MPNHKKVSYKKKCSVKRSRKVKRTSKPKKTSRKVQRGGSKRKREGEDLMDMLTKKMTKVTVEDKKEDHLIDKLIKKLKNLYIEEPKEIKEHKKIIKLEKELSMTHKQAHDNLKELKHSMVGIKGLRRSPRNKK
jgi:hypothetical protein